MDVVVVDIPPKFVMLLSRSWAAKLKGDFQMDMSYATIPVFGVQRRLFTYLLWLQLFSQIFKILDPPFNFIFPGLLKSVVPLLQF